MMNSENSTRKSKNLMIPMRIVCVFLAVCIWVLVVNITSDKYEQSFEMEIKVDGNDSLTEKGISVYEKSDNKLSVVVRGPRDVILSLQPENFRAYIDVSTLTEAGRKELPVKVIVPDNVALVSFSPDIVEVSADIMTDKHVFLEAELKNYSNTKDYEISAKTITPSTITLSGPASVLDKITKAKLVSNLGGISLSDSFENIPESIVLLDAKENAVAQDFITFSSDNIKISVKVSRTVSVPLAVEYASGFDSSKIEKTELSVKSVALKGEKSVLDSLSKLVMKLDEKTAQDSEIKLGSLVLPEGVTWADEADRDKSVTVHFTYKPVITDPPVTEVTSGAAEP